jgi:DNA-binding GntR family transcriptional regulator
MTAEEIRPNASIYELIREDIVRGRLPSGSRLKVSDLAIRYGTSTNPVREALQQLRGEGFVVISHNRGARVRPIDEDFVRDMYEITSLIEPYLTQWFVGHATAADIRLMREIQAEIDTLNFDDNEAYSRLDERFHRVVYDRHYNRHSVDLWWRHRDILRAISRDFPFSLSRRQAIIEEHRGIIASIEQQNAELAAAITRRHVLGSGQHIIEHMRSARLRQAS